MRTISISISELEFDKFGLKNNELPFSDFLDLVSRELSRQTLNKSVMLAQKYGLDTLTMEDILGEIKLARQDAKNHS